MFDELRRVALFSSGVVELTRHQAEQLVKEFVKKGDVRRQQTQDAVRDLVRTSRESRRELLRFVRGEVEAQIENLGVVTRRDVERLERRIARLEQGGAAKTSGTRKKSTAKKTAKKSTAKKSTARSSSKTTSSGSSSS